MLGRWLRIGDFRKISEEFTHTEAHQVRYVADSDVAVATQIYVFATNDRHRPGQISVTFSPFYLQQGTAACDALSISYEFERETFSLDTKKKKHPPATLTAVACTARLDMTKENGIKLIKLFDILNAGHQAPPFTEELALELVDIFVHKIHSSFHLMQHRIEEFEIKDIYFESDQLSAHLIGCDDIYQYQSLLIEGHVGIGNLAVGCMFPPLAYSMLCQADNDQTEVLLWYKANPFTRPKRGLHSGGYGKYSFSAYELAFSTGAYDKVNYIIDEYSELKKSRALSTGNRAGLTFVSSAIDYLNHQIISQFVTTTNMIMTTRMMRVEALWDDSHEMEKIAVFKLLAQEFEASNDDDHGKIRDYFEREFKDKKYIDIVYSNGRVIGFTLFRFLNSHRQKNVTLVYCDWGIIDKAYRGNGLMYFLSFRQAYIMQLVKPNDRVMLMYSALTYNSYRMVYDVQHAPKYCSQETDLLVRDFLDMIYPPGYVYNHKHLMSYIKEELKLRSGKPHKPSLNERVYTREILGHRQPDSMSEPRSAPVAFFVGENDYLQMLNIARDLGIDFVEHIGCYAKYLSAMLHRSDNQLAIKFSLFMRAGGSLLGSEQISKTMGNKL